MCLTLYVLFYSLRRVWVTWRATKVHTCTHLDWEGKPCSDSSTSGAKTFRGSEEMHKWHSHICTVCSSWEIQKCRQACSSTPKNTHMASHVCVLYVCMQTKSMLSHILWSQLAVPWVVSMCFDFMYEKRLVFYHSVSDRNTSRCCNFLRGISTSQRSPLSGQDKTSQIKAQSFLHGWPTNTKWYVLWNESSVTQ